MNQFDVVEVTWLDASIDNSWISVEDSKVQQNFIINTVGYRLRQDKHSIRISQQFDTKDQEVKGSVEIPMGMILKLRILRKGKKKK